MDHVEDFLSAIVDAVEDLDAEQVGNLVTHLLALRHMGGRLFCLGSGGGAAHASHACCDFRKLCGIEAYCPSDNAAELTARTNDDGWARAYVDWLMASRMGSADCLLVISVGGGDKVRNVSPNLTAAVEYAKGRLGATVLGICGRDGGDTARLADCCVVIKAPERFTTPVVEGMQGVLLHALASHPLLQRAPAKWEGMKCDPASS